jgi:glycine cleavage system P protein (glycine dehydrogenase)
MIESTESESLVQLDRFCEAMIHIREQIRDIEVGRASKTDNVLKLAPHTALDLAENDWASSLFTHAGLLSVSRSRCKILGASQ